MKSAPSQTIDFNQMLVVSVFFHFLLFTTFMFLPQTQDAVKRIKPAFMVSLVNIPAGPDVKTAPHVKKSVAPPPAKPIPKKPEPIAKPKPIPKKPEPVLKPITKSVPAPKSKPKPVVEKPVPSKALSKLDELAKLQNKKIIPKKDKLAMAVPKPLDDIKNMTMKTEVEKKKNPTRKKIARDELDREFEKWSKKPVHHQNEPKKTSSIQKKFEDLEKLKELNKEAHAVPGKKKGDIEPDLFTVQILMEPWEYMLVAHEEDQKQHKGNRKK